MYQDSGYFTLRPSYNIEDDLVDNTYISNYFYTFYVWVKPKEHRYQIFYVFVGHVHYNRTIIWLILYEIS